MSCGQLKKKKIKQGSMSWDEGLRRRYGLSWEMLPEQKAKCREGGMNHSLDAFSLVALSDGYHL